MKKSATLVTTLCILLSSSAFGAAKSGIVLGFNVGMGELTNKRDTCLGNIPNDARESCSEENGNVAFGGIIGYDYALMRNLSLGFETGINYSPEIAKTNVTSYNGPPIALIQSSKMNNLNIPMLLTVKYYLGSFVINAKAGYSYIRQEWEQNNIDEHGAGTIWYDRTGTTRTSNWKPMLALGIGYEIIDNLSITAQYATIFGKTNINDNNTVLLIRKLLPLKI